MFEQNRLKALEKRHKLIEQRRYPLKTNNQKSENTKIRNLQMNKIKGDLIKLALKGDFDVIVHGCNCFCTMGAGIALAIKTIFPEAYKADLQTEKGDREKLGSYTAATVEKNGHQITVVNAYTQYHYGGPGNKVDYDALRAVFSKIKRDFTGQRIGYPLIGAGLAGGDWKLISKIIDEELKDENHTVVVYSGHISSLVFSFLVDRC